MERGRRGGTIIRALVITALVLLVLLVAAPIVVVRYFLTPEWINSRLLPPLEQRIGRDLEVEALSLGLGRASLTGVTISEDPRFAPAASTPFVSVERLTVVLDLSSLLQRRLVVSKLLLEGPSLRVVRDHSGELNFSSLGGSRRDRTSRRDRPSRLELESLRIDGGHLVLIDNRGGGEPRRTELEGLDLVAAGKLSSEPRELVGRLSIERGSVRGLALAGLEAELSLVDGVLRISGMEMGVAGGRLRLNVRSKLSGDRAFGATLELDDVSLAKLRAELRPDSPLRPSGELDFELELRGAGSDRDAMLTKLEGSGEIDIAAGRIEGSPALRTAGKLTGIKGLGELELRDAGGRFTISGGRVASDRLMLGGSQARLVVMGSVGFDRSLDLEAWVGVAPGARRELLAPGILLPYLEDKEGWTNIPVAITGTVAEPRMAIPTRAIAQTMLTLIPDTAGRIVSEGSSATERVLKEGIDLPGTILREGAERMRAILDELEQVLEGGER